MTGNNQAQTKAFRAGAPVSGVFYQAASGTPNSSAFHAVEDSLHGIGRPSPRADLASSAARSKEAKQPAAQGKPLPHPRDFRFHNASRNARRGQNFFQTRKQVLQGVASRAFHAPGIP